MNKKQRGTTLVEVLVSIAVFAVVSAGMLMSAAAVRKITARQEEYLRFEMVCRDIDFYSDAYGAAWDEHYFADKIITEQNGGEVYYGGDFDPSVTAQVYRLAYSYNTNGELIVSVEHVASGRKIIDDLNYGDGRYGARK